MKVTVAGYARELWRPVAFVVVLAALLALGSPVARRAVGYAAEPGARVPRFSPPPGVYSRDVRVTLRATHPRGQVVFTTDGTLPTAAVGTLYARPLHLDAASPQVVVIRAVEVVDGVPGPVASATYVLGVQSGLPVVSLIAEPAALWDAGRGILANPTWRGPAWERPVHVDYVAPGGGFAISGGLRVDDAAQKPSLRLYFRREYGAARLRYPLFADHPYQPDGAQVYKRLLLQAGDKSGRWTFFRDQLVAEVATDLGLHAAQGRFVQLFVNGESWGLYRLSERIDRFYLEDDCGIRNADLVQDGRPREGSDDAWDALVDWVAAHDLADPANFDYVAARVDLDDLTDWAALQFYFGFPAEVLYAARPPGGRWFFLYAGDGGAFAARPEASLVALRGAADADFAVLLRALLENPAYRERFARRMTVLCDTVLSRPSMQRRGAALAETLRPAISYEEARWPSPLPWQAGVDAFLGQFVAARPQQVLAQVAEALGLGEVAGLLVDVSPNPLSGRVYLEGVPLFIDSEPWEGYVLPGVPVTFTAVPAHGNAFAGWGTGGNAVTLTVDGPRHTVATFVPADGAALRPDDVVIDEVWINDNGTRYASVGNRPIEGDWIELRVQRDVVDLRGWRLTDNDTLAGTAEGSLIFPDVAALASVRRGTIVLVVATVTERNGLYFPVDDVDPRDGRLVFYAGNGNLDVTTDPGFGLGTGDDNLVLLAPGPGPAFADDVGVDFVAEGGAVTPFTFGVLADGVTFDAPFRRLGDDDGAIFAGGGSNDRLEAWLVDPPAYRSGDALRVDSPNVVTPGRRNPARWLLQPRP